MAGSLVKFLTGIFVIQRVFLLLQLQRKRHIGNDIALVVFQDGDTPFVPNMIASQFLHSFIVVRPLDRNDPDTSYRVSVAARADVPAFGPEREGTLRPNGVRDFLLTKLINAEHAAYRAHKIAELHVSDALKQDVLVYAAFT